MGWTLIFSPILWEHYQAYLAVFWGWLAAESNRSPGRRGVAGAIMLLLYIPTQAMRFASQIPEPIASHLLWGTVLWTAVATIAIWRKGDRESFVR